MLQKVQNLLLQLAEMFTTPLLFVGDTYISLSLLLKLCLYLITVLIFGRIFKNLLKKVFLVKLGIDEANREAISTIFSYGVSTLGVIII
ncbi:MAG: mechanosensitive ion channel protein MscS, partial [Okeania sp. SIO2D1]|nr:mechanosensitive ion channel protein MscS [Okeania sp. SIO2D1]